MKNFNDPLKFSILFLDQQYIVEKVSLFYSILIINMFVIRSS